MKQMGRFILLLAAAALPLAAQTATPGKRPARSPVPQAVAEKVNWTAGVSLGYDGGGHLVSMGTDTFLYDDIGRLVQAKVATHQQAYTYDAFGNRKTCTGNGDCQFGVREESATNRMTLATYDPGGSGNVIKYGTHEYKYDALNTTVRDQNGSETVDYIYTADGERLAVYTPSAQSWRWTVRDTNNKVLREFTSKDGAVPGKESPKWSKDYVYRDALPLATRQFDPFQQAVTTYHLHLDHLGTPRRITDRADAIVGTHDYYPFGPEMSGGTNEPVRVHLKYTGHERDTQDGQYALDYMHARYYNGAVARFFTPDPLLSVRDEIARPQRWNRYAYVLNSPVDAKDPDGREVKATFYMRSGVLVVRDLDTNRVMRIERVFSGKAPYINDASAANRKDAGPIPPGKYLIGEAYNRQPGSPGNYMWYRLWGWNEARGGYHFHPPGVELKGPSGGTVQRTVMNLHTGAGSIGCLTVPSDIPNGRTNYPQSAQYDQLRQMLDNTTPLVYKGTNFTGRLTVLDAKDPSAAPAPREKTWWETLLSIFD